MAGKTLEELLEIKKNQEYEESRVKMSLNLNICPNCGNNLNLKCVFFKRKLICTCGYQITLIISDGGWE